MKPPKPSFSVTSSRKEQEFNIRKAAASSLVSTMVRKQLIVRVPAPNDARYKQLLLTTQARQLATQIDAFFEASEQRIHQLLAEKTSLTYDSLTQISSTFTATNTPKP